MNDSVEQLVKVAGSALHEGFRGINEAVVSEEILKASGLHNLLTLKNGFYAFEGALHVFPSEPSAHEHGLEAWNSSALWRSDYRDLASGCFFFAEDIFGGQFCLYDGAIHSFDPETGEKVFLASDFGMWARRILTECEVLTGYPLAHEWQLRNGRVPPGHRLIPKLPFVLGGEFDASNLFLLDAVKAMRYRADIALQIRDLPDGAEVKLRTIE